MNLSGVRLNLEKIKVDIEDTSYNSSDYFVVTELPDVLTSGKNCIAINGSDILKVNSPIQIEVLDVNNNTLFTQVGRSRSQFRDGVSTIISIHVFQSTPLGVGKIILVGTTTNNKTVRWTKKIPINSILNNKTTVRFFNEPKLQVEPEVTRILYYNPSNGGITSSSFTVSSLAVNPTANTNFNNFDVFRDTLDYRLIHQTGNFFSSSMDGNVINITYPIIDYPFSQSKEIEIEKVLNKTTLKLKQPIIYPNTELNQNVYTFNNANATVKHINAPKGELTQTIDAGGNISSSIKLFTSLANIKVSNLETFTGNVFRFRIYRKSLNSFPDSECISDELFESREEFTDKTFPDRFRDKLGFFIDQSHITGDPLDSDDGGYWRVNPINSVSLLKDDNFFIDGMYISGSDISPNESFNYRFQVNSYDNNSLFGTNVLGSSPTIISRENEFGNFVNEVVPVNSIQLNKNVEYIISFNLYGLKPFGVNNTGKVAFYLIDSINNTTQDKASSENFDGFGIKIGEAVMERGISHKNFDKLEFSLTPRKNIEGQFVIVPYYGDYIISEISVKAFQSFSFSPEILSLKVPWPVTIANEAFEIKIELFDVNNNSIPNNLITKDFFDPNGLTVYDRQQSQSQAPVSSVFNAEFANIATTAITADTSSFSQTSVSSSFSQTSISSSFSLNSKFSISSSYSTVSDTSSVINYDSSYTGSSLFNIGKYYFWITTGSTPQLRFKDGIPNYDTDGFSVS